MLTTKKQLKKIHKEPLLAEGGLTLEDLEKFNTSNDKDENGAKKNSKSSKSKTSDETYIDGLQEFDKYGPLF